MTGSPSPRAFLIAFGAMAKKKAAAVEPAKATSAPPAKEVAEAPRKGKKDKGNVEAPKKEFLSAFRPKPRFIFLFQFVALCAAVVVFYDPCAVKGKRKDCGYPGITPGACQTWACYTRGNSPTIEKTLKVKREAGSKLGLALAVDPKDKDKQTVQEVSDGAVKEHNAQATEANQMIQPGDRVVTLDGAAGNKMIIEALDKTTEKTVEIKIQRPRLPGWLQWVHNKQGRFNFLESVLTSSGTAHFVKQWSFMAKLGALCWLVSGYPVTSLPIYFVISAGLSVQLTRCCHDDKVPSGQPHCAKSSGEPMTQVLEKVWLTIKEKVDMVAKDPRGWFEWLFIHGK